MYFRHIVKKKNLILAVVMVCGLLFLHSDIASGDITSYFCEAHRNCADSELLYCNTDTDQYPTAKQSYYASDMGIGTEGTQSNKTRRTKSNPTVRTMSLGKNPRYIHSSRPSHIHRSPIFVAPKAINRLVIIGRMTI